MTLVKAYEMSRLWMIFFALYASYASCTAVSSCPESCCRRRTHQQEREYDASEEQPSADTERDVDTPVAIVRGTRVEDGVGPRRGGKHGDCGEDIGDVDEEGNEHADVEPEVPVVGVDSD